MLLFIICAKSNTYMYSKGADTQIQARFRSAEQVVAFLKTILSILRMDVGHRVPILHFTGSLREATTIWAEPCKGSKLKESIRKPLPDFFDSYPWRLLNSIFIKSLYRKREGVYSGFSLLLLDMFLWEFQNYHWQKHKKWNPSNNSQRSCCPSSNPNGGFCIPANQLLHCKMICSHTMLLESKRQLWPISKGLWIAGRILDLLFSPS